MWAELGCEQWAATLGWSVEGRPHVREHRTMLMSSGHLSAKWYDVTTHDGDVTIESEVCENPGIVTFQHGRGVTVMFQICRYKELLTHNVWDRRKIITSLQLNIFCSKPIISRWQAIDYQVWRGRVPHTPIWAHDVVSAFLHVTSTSFLDVDGRFEPIFIHFFIVPWMWLMMDEALFVPHSPDNPCRGRGWDPGYEALIYCFSGPGSGTCHWYRGCLMIWTQSSRDSNTQILHTHWAVSPVITVTAWSTAGGCSTLWQRNWDFQRNSRHDSIQSKENESWLYFSIVIHSCSVLLLPCFLCLVNANFCNASEI